MKRYYIYTIYFLVLIFFLFQWFFSTSDEYTIVLMIIILLLISSLPFLIEKKISLYNPIFILSVYFFITYGLGALFILIYPDLDAFNVRLTGIKEAIEFSLLGFAVFLTGFYILKIKPFENYKRRIISFLPKVNKYEIDGNRIFLLSLVLFILGWLARIYWFNTGAYYFSLNTEEVITITINPLIRQFIVIIVTFPLLLLLIYVYLYIEKRGKRYLYLSILLMIFELVYWLPSGSKEQLFIPLFFSLVMVSFKKRVPLKSAISVVLFTIFVIFPFINLYRIQNVGNLNYTLYLFKEMYSGFNFQTFEGIIKYTFGMRFNYALVLSVVMQRAENVWGFLQGATYVDFFTQLIPRFMWPDKPAIEMGQSFGVAFGIIPPFDYITSVGMTWLGEAFINFGWYGILIPLFIGIIFRLFYDYFFSAGIPNLLFSLFYVIIFYNLIRLETTFAPQLSGILKSCFIYLIVFIPFIKVMPRFSR